MVTEYPHTIITNGTELVTEPYQDENGDWVLPAPGEVNLISQKGCAEINGSGAKVPSQGGEKVEYSYMVYLPSNATEIVYGQTVTIKDDKGAQIGTGTALAFFRGSMNARVWI